MNTLLRRFKGSKIPATSLRSKKGRSSGVQTLHPKPLTLIQGRLGFLRSPSQCFVFFEPRQLLVPWLLGLSDKSGRKYQNCSSAVVESFLLWMSCLKAKALNPKP